MVEGFALAGALVRDSDLTAAEPGAPKEEIARARQCLTGGAQARATKMRAIARRLQPETLSAEVPLSTRAKVLVAEFAARELGSTWLARAKATRRGYTAPPSLRRLLAREAARLQQADPAAEGQERAAGRDLLVRAERELDPADHARWLAELGAEEAGAIMALAPLVHADAGIAPVERVCLTIASNMAKGKARVRILGAMLLGARGVVGGDPVSAAWRRAGAEIAEIGVEVSSIENGGI